MPKNGKGKKGKNGKAPYNGKRLEAQRLEAEAVLLGHEAERKKREAENSKIQEKKKRNAKLHEERQEENQRPFWWPPGMPVPGKGKRGKNKEANWPSYFGNEYAYYNYGAIKNEQDNPIVVISDEKIVGDVSRISYRVGVHHAKPRDTAGQWKADLPPAPTNVPRGKVAHVRERNGMLAPVAPVWRLPDPMDGLTDEGWAAVAPGLEPAKPDVDPFHLAAQMQLHQQAKAASDDPIEAAKVALGQLRAQRTSTAFGQAGRVYNEYGGYYNRFRQPLHPDGRLLLDMQGEPLVPVADWDPKVLGQPAIATQPGQVVLEPGLEPLTRISLPRARTLEHCVAAGDLLDFLRSINMAPERTHIDKSCEAVVLEFRASVLGQTLPQYRRYMHGAGCPCICCEDCRPTEEYREAMELCAFDDIDDSMEEIGTSQVLRDPELRDMALDMVCAHDSRQKNSYLEQVGSAEAQALVEDHWNTKKREWMEGAIQGHRQYIFGTGLKWFNE